MRKSAGDKGDFWHLWSSKHEADGCNGLARYDFLLVFYSDLMSRWNRVKLQAVDVSSIIIANNNNNQFGDIYRTTFFLTSLNHKLSTTVTYQSWYETRTLYWDSVTTR